jgi:hypothetical protein
LQCFPVVKSNWIERSVVFKAQPAQGVRVAGGYGPSYVGVGCRPLAFGILSRRIIIRVNNQLKLTAPNTPSLGVSPMFNVVANFFTIPGYALI